MWLMITRSISYRKRTACVDVIGIIVPTAEAGFRDAGGRSALEMMLRRWRLSVPLSAVSHSFGTW